MKNHRRNNALVSWTRNPQIVRETMRSRRKIMKMRNKWQVAPVKLLGLAALFLTFALSASAQTLIAYVAFNGSDANACTRTAQCKTIAHALTVVLADGVVKITASGSYDTFTGTAQESDEGCILGGFLENDD